MADKDNKVKGSVVGKYYVDTQCIDCGLCCDTAPDNFAHNDEDGFAFVSKQPDSDDEGELCVEAKDSCPVDAVGDDGE